VILENKAKGIDVSKWQGEINWRQVGSVIDFAYIKATEGASYRDPKFVRNVTNAAKDAPRVLLGAYHFARVSGSPRDAAEEADNFSTALRVVDNRLSLPPMLDIEWDKRSADVKGADVVRWVAEFLAQMDVDLGIPICGIYTQHSFWLYRMLKTQRFGSRTLWLASPVKNGQPTRPIPGWSPTIVQYSAKGSIPGIEGNVDLDYWWSGEEISRTPSMMIALLQNIAAKFNTPSRSSTP